LKPSTRSSLSNLLNDFARWRSMCSEDSETVDHTELAEIVLDESGYTGMLMVDKSPEAPGRLDNLKELITAMGEFENLGGFLEHVSLVMENTENPSADMVNIMTLHGAKGLEFKTVFLPGWEEGLFPHQRHIDESGEAGLEEERRLAYVGLTRAKNLAIVTFALNRQVHGQWKSSISSRFLEELPLDQIVVENELETSVVENLYEKSPSSNVAFSRNKVIPSSNVYQTASENINDKNAESFLIDERIFHQKFGYGKIIEVDMNKLTIDFEKAGIKKVLDSFVVAADSV
jgi:DNA helicase-2/ATP-dependent DNA helicase PcrA